MTRDEVRERLDAVIQWHRDMYGENSWYAIHRAVVESEHAAAQEAKRLAQVVEINRHLGKIDEMGIEH